MATTIQKWGNSAAIRLPRQALHAAGFRVGQKLELSGEPGRLVLSPAAETLADLLAKITLENQHGLRLDDEAAVYPPRGAVMRSVVIKLRPSAGQHALIRRAASGQDSTPAKFVLDAATEAARAILLDKALFKLKTKDFQQFNASVRAASHASSTSAS